MIRLFDLSLSPVLQRELEHKVIETLRVGQFVLGERVARFERQFAKMFNAPYAVGVASGTDALILALRALEIGPGDEVIVPALSFYASAEAVLQVGARPVLVDVDDDTLTLSVAATEAAIRAKTAAIMPVHLYGHPADMPGLMALARRYNLAVIEDAAQAVGAKIAGRFVGEWGDACCYSFYPTKNLGAAGDGGLLTTPHARLAAKARQLRVHAQHGAYYHDDIGYTSRLDAIQAVILAAKLPHLASWNERRREHARAYQHAFAGLLDVGLPPWHEEDVFHLYNLRVRNRDAVMSALNERGVEARAYYPHTLADLPPLQGCAHDGCPVARKAAGEILALPLHPNLSDAERDTVIKIVSEVIKTL